MIKKKNIFIVLIFIIIIFIIFSIFVSDDNDYIEYVLETKSYSYLPLEAKNYIKEIYEETGEVILTEKNKKTNKTYLNPKYIEYLEMSSEEKENVELIPDTYILDFLPGESYSNSTLPASYDLRNVDGNVYVSPIKNQGTTEICWAFASIENVETFIMKQNDQTYSDSLPNFSIRQMDYATSNDGLIKKYVNQSTVSCEPEDSCLFYTWDNLDNASRKVGTGGNFFTSSIVMANALTLVEESVLPWNEEKRSFFPKKILNYDNSLYEVDSTIQMPTINANATTDEITNEYVNIIKNYMLQYGGPFVGTYSPKSTCGFQNIDGSKVIKSDDCANSSENKYQGHAMQIIGWDDDYEYSYCDNGYKHYAAGNGEKCTYGYYQEGKGAWILKNSWGEETEEASEYKYVYLTYDSTRLSIGFVTSLSEMDNRTWDNNYHSNPWIDKDLSKGMASIVTHTQKFNTNNIENEKIEKIKFFTASRNGKYTLTISSENEKYENIAVATPSEAGIYTFDLSNKNIIITDSSFSVKIVSENNSSFFKDSISVFTSNAKEEEYAISYSDDAYNSSKPLSNENPLYIDITYTPNTDIYEWETTLNSYLKNIPQYSDLTYRIKKGNTIVTSYGDKSVYYDGSVAVAKFSGDSKNYYSNFNINNEFGETWTMEIMYNNQEVNSFPIKFNQGYEKSNSNVILHSNLENDYSITYSATDKELHKFEDINGDENFYNNGYYIKSWNTKADGSGTSYNIENGIMVFHDMELYAEWSNEKMNIIVSFKSKIDEEPIEIKTYKYDDKVTMPVNTTIEENKVFSRWEYQKNNSIFSLYEQEETTGKISSYLDYPIFNNPEIEFVGVWLDEYVTIEFDSNGGTGEMKSINVEPYINSSNLKFMRLKNNLFVKENCIFTGWNTKADGTGISYTDEEEISVTKNTTLYAQWQQESITLIFDSNGGTGSMVNQIFAYEVLQKLNKNTFTKTGHIFTGWNTKADGTGISYTDKEEISVTKNTTLYAQWQQESITLIFDSNGGTGSMVNQIFAYKVLQKLNKNTFTKTGHIFTGWNTKADGTGISYTDEEEISVTKNTTLYAQWQESYSYIINKYSYNDKTRHIDKIDINTTLEMFNNNIKLNIGYTIKVDSKVINNKSILYTGGKTKIYKNNNLLIEYKNIIRGEVNGDGKINYLDYVDVYNHIQKSKHSELDKKELSDVYLIASDIAEDNKVNYLDYVQIYNKIKELKGGTN